MGSPTTTGTAFNTLASYLFGYNTKKEAMAMTTPVEIRRGGGGGGGGEGGYSMSFVMPSKFTTTTAPSPVDERVVLSDTPQEVLAAKEFPGEEREVVGRRSEEGEEVVVMVVVQLMGLFAL